MKHLLPQFARFVLIGGISTALQYLILAMGVEWLDADPVLASVCGFAISAVFGYVMSHRYTFASAVPHRLAVMRFCAVVGVGLLLNALLMQVLYRYLHWHYLLAQVLTTGGTMLWHFIAHRRWTFEASPQA